MEKLKTMLLLLTVSAVLTAADDSYEAAAKITMLSNVVGSPLKSLKDKLICLERKLKVVNQCEKMLANVRSCNEGDYNSGYCRQLVYELL